MDRDDIDRVRIEAKTRDIIPVYLYGWDAYKWAWLEYNRKDKSWTYGGMQKRKDKVDENEGGQERIKEMFADNQIDIKEGGGTKWG